MNTPEEFDRKLFDKLSEVEETPSMDVWKSIQSRMTVATGVTEVKEVSDLASVSASSKLASLVGSKLFIPILSVLLSVMGSLITYKVISTIDKKADIVASAAASEVTGSVNEAKNNAGISDAVKTCEEQSVVIEKQSLITDTALDATKPVSTNQDNSTSRIISGKKASDNTSGSAFTKKNKNINADELTANNEVSRKSGNNNQFPNNRPTAKMNDRSALTRKQIPSADGSVTFSQTEKIAALKELKMLGETSISSSLVVNQPSDILSPSTTSNSTEQNNASSVKAEKQLTPFSIHVHYGYASPKRAVNTNSEFIKRLDSAEVIHSASSYGVALAYEWRGFDFKTGVEMIQWKSDFNFIKHDRTTEVTVDSTYSGSIVDPFSAPKPVYDYDTIVTVTDLYDTVSSINHIRQLSIPVGVNYNYSFGKFAMYGGISTRVDIKTSIDGMTINTLNKDEVISKENSASVFDPKALRMKLCVGGSYEITRRAFVFAEPFFERDLRSLVNAHASNPYTFILYGVNAGVKIKI
jgi:hypothetical protein